MVYDALYDAKILDYIDDNDVDGILDELVDEFYNKFKFVSIEVVDAFETVYKIKYSFKGIENSIVGRILDYEFIPVEELEL